MLARTRRRRFPAGARRSFAHGLLVDGEAVRSRPRSFQAEARTPGLLPEQASSRSVPPRSPTKESSRVRTVRGAAQPRPSAGQGAISCHGQARAGSIVRPRLRVRRTSPSCVGLCHGHHPAPQRASDVRVPPSPSWCGHDRSAGGIPVVVDADLWMDERRSSALPRHILSRSVRCSPGCGAASGCPHQAATVAEPSSVSVRQARRPSQSSRRPRRPTPSEKKRGSCRPRRPHIPFLLPCSRHPS